MGKMGAEVTTLQVSSLCGSHSIWTAAICLGLARALRGTFVRCRSLLVWAATVEGGVAAATLMVWTLGWCQAVRAATKRR